MTKEKQTGLGDELFGTPMAAASKASGTTKGEFVPPSDVPDVDEPQDEWDAEDEEADDAEKVGSIGNEAELMEAER